jgi:hypothetical protein
MFTCGGCELTEGYVPERMRGVKAWMRSTGFIYRELCTLMSPFIELIR